MSKIKLGNLKSYSNPNGTLWSKDTNSLGLKLLTKLGWKSGSGLGKEENGLIEPIKPSIQFDKKGLGCKEPSYAEGIKQQQDYSGLLSSLANTYGTILPEFKKPMNLEEKSKSSKVRMHYAKFTRAKDVSRYSKEALDIILGCPAKADISTNVDIPKNIETNLIKSSTNMKEYFKNKQNVVEQIISEDLTKLAFVSENVSLDSANAKEQDDYSCSIKKRKNKKRKMDETDANESTNTIIDVSLSIMDVNNLKDITHLPVNTEESSNLDHPKKRKVDDDKHMDVIKETCTVDGLLKKKTKRRTDETAVCLSNKSKLVNGENDNQDSIAENLETSKIEYKMRDENKTLKMGEDKTHMKKTDINNLQVADEDDMQSSLSLKRSDEEEWQVASTKKRKSKYKKNNDCVLEESVVTDKETKDEITDFAGSLVNEQKNEKANIRSTFWFAVKDIAGYQYY